MRNSGKLHGPVILAVITAFSFCTCFFYINPGPDFDSDDLLVLQNLNYTENPVDIPNPDRGFYITHNNTVPVSGGRSGGDADITSSSISGIGISPRICHMYFDLRNFSNKAGGTTQALTESALDYIRATLEKIRNGNGIIIIRFVYQQGSAYNRKDGPEPVGNCTIAGHTGKNWIQYHIYQLKPILHEYEDVIMALDGGFFGSWGEMHTTEFATKAENYVWLLDALLDALPASRQILVHAGGFLAWYNAKFGTVYNFSNIDTMPAPLRGSPAARFGMFDDSYLANHDDNGSLWEGNNLVNGSYNRNRIVTWIGKQNNFFGGETNSDGNVADYNRFPFLAWEAPRTHTSHLNLEYYAGVLNGWGSFTYTESGVTVQLGNSHPFANQRAVFDPVYNGRNGIEFIRDRLGYRLVLREARASGSVAHNGILKFRGKIQNVGWGNVVNRKNVYAILKSKTGTGVYVSLTNLDARDWLSDPDGRASNTTAYHDISFNINLGTINNFPPGQYDIYLKIADPKETSANKRCIRFANKAPSGITIWDSTLGANLIGTTEVL